MSSQVWILLIFTVTYENMPPTKSASTLLSKLTFFPNVPHSTRTLKRNRKYKSRDPSTFCLVINKRSLPLKANSILVPTAKNMVVITLE